MFVLFIHDVHWLNQQLLLIRYEELDQCLVCESWCCSFLCALLYLCVVFFWFISEIWKNNNFEQWWSTIPPISTSNHSQKIIEHKKDSNMRRWQSISWLGTCTTHFVEVNLINLTQTIYFFIIESPTTMMTYISVFVLEKGVELCNHWMMRLISRVHNKTELEEIKGGNQKL